MTTTKKQKADELRAKLAQYRSLAKEFPDGMTAKNIVFCRQRLNKSCASMARLASRYRKRMELYGRGVSGGSQTPAAS